ncbi:MAG: hypothetical protein U5Q16_16880 [Gammaproteobacteria bacterium]|nr:hypothetical protein [Gammaproteobacteria bacterium]
MNREEQRAVRHLWQHFLAGRRPSGMLMRTFYVEVLAYTDHYRYGSAPEIFDVLINGEFELGEDAVLWSKAGCAADDHRAA